MKINLVDEFCQLLFTWMIPHSDDFGRLDGEPEVIKALVMPLSRRTVSEFNQALYGLALVELIDWYSVNHKKVIEIINADDHQSNLVGKRTKSKFPEKEEGYVGFRDFPGISKKFFPNLTKPNLTKPNLTQPNPASLEKALGGFEVFWKNYPKRKSKGQAEKAWHRIKPNEQLLGIILTALEQAKTSEQWVKETGRYIPNPATWLNAKGWEDEHLETADPFSAFVKKGA